MDLIQRWISHWEGRRSFVYRDTNGIPTIGVGFNLRTGIARTEIAAVGLDFERVLSGEVSLSQDQIDQLLTRCIEIALTSARILVPLFEELPDNQKLVITDLSFNMGQATLSKFTKTLAAINSQQWEKAADALKNSSWFLQVGSRPTQRGGADVAVLGNAAAPQNILTRP